MATNAASSDLFCDVVPDSAATDGHARVPPSFVADTASEGSLPLPSSESSGVSSGPSSVASDSDDGKPTFFHCSDAALSPSSRAHRWSDAQCRAELVLRRHLSSAEWLHAALAVGDDANREAAQTLLLELVKERTIYAKIKI